VLGGVDVTTVGTGGEKLLLAPRQYHSRFLPKHS